MIDHFPTDAQKAAGNYRKEHLSFQGIPITLENRKGSIRSGVSGNGRKWSCELPADYGYIKRTEGADGDHVDVYVGPDPNSKVAVIVNQQDHNTGRFDEHKICLGWPSEAEAVKAYCAAFSDGKGHCRIKSVEVMSVDALKAWLKTGDTRRPAKAPRIIDHALGIAMKAAKRYGGATRGAINVRTR